MAQSGREPKYIITGRNNVSGLPDQIIIPFKISDSRRETVVHYQPKVPK